MTGTTQPQLILTSQQVAQIIDHARTARPEEACGLLGGRGGRVERIYPLPNMEQSPVRYLAEPQAQVDAMLEVEERGNEIVGIYHSHLDAPAYPSPTDVTMAAYPEGVHLIISLADGNSPVLGAFHIRDGEIEEVEIAIENPEPVRG
jgi:proteasome lid subunit RPN8/RPN11